MELIYYIICKVIEFKYLNNEVVILDLFGSFDEVKQVSYCDFNDNIDFNNIREFFYSDDELL